MWTKMLHVTYPINLMGLVMPLMLADCLMYNVISMPTESFSLEHIH